MRVITVLKRVLGLCHRVVVTGYELIETGDGRPHLVVNVRVLARLPGRCGQCALPCSW